MVFSSLTFLFFFLPAVLLLYYLNGSRRWRNAVLLVASLLFYAWGEPRYVLVMLAAALVAYLGGLLMARGGAWRKPVFAVTVLLLLGNLFFHKYLGFALENLSRIPGLTLRAGQVTLPLGISFYTFQILSYVIDLYNGRVGVQRSFFRLLLYVSLFPQLIAGPIVRYQTVENEIPERRETAEDLCAGLERFILGLGKKVLIANNVAAIAETIYAGDGRLVGAAALCVASLAYTLQIYFDFSGYSDMAIGLGRLFGFHFPENFARPYAALSVTDFWRRWHISLSSWFRDYVYIPLGGNRVSRGRWAFNLLLVWALTGLWHGAGWNFILWGLYYGLLLLLEKTLFVRWSEAAPKLLRGLVTFLIVNFGWILFDLADLSVLGDVLRRLFLLAPTDWTGLLAENIELVKAPLYLGAGLLALVMERKLSLRGGGTARAALRGALSLGVLMLCVVFLLSGTYNPFIYFRF